MKHVGFAFQMNKRMANSSLKVGELMKKIIAVAIMAFIMLDMAVIAYADSVKRIDEFKMTITVPDSYSVFMRGMDANDPLYKKFGFNKTDMENIFSSAHMYLDAITDDSSSEFVVTGNYAGLADFSTANDNVIKSLVKTIVSNYEEAEGVIAGEEMTVIKNNQTKFVSYEIIYDDSYEMYGRQYTTCNNGNVVIVSFHEKNEISSSTIKKMDNIVKSIAFDSVETTKQPTNIGQSFTYTDANTGSTIVVPEGWEQTEFLTEQKFYSAKFSCQKEKGISILFGSYDLYNEYLQSDEIPQSDKYSFHRSDFNISLFEKSDISNMLEVPVSSLSEVSLGGNKFFKYGLDSNTEKYGIKLSTHSTVFYTLVNGWQYSFMYFGDENDEYYPEFEKLVSSFKTNSSLENEPSKDYRSSEKSKDSSKNIITIIFLVLLAVAGVICFVVIKSKKAKDQTISENNISPDMTGHNDGLQVSSVNNQHESIHKNDPVFSDEHIDDEASHCSQEQAVFCRKCGAKLVEGSQFCNKCGEKI